jgi:hypothetical protein
MIELFQTTCRIGDRDELYSVRILHEFGKGDGYLDPTKIRDMWAAVKGHKVLFSDQTFGKAELFLTVLLDPTSVWLDIVRLPEDESVGVIHLSNVIPGFDAKGHFWIWDGAARPRKEIFFQAMEWVFERYGLHRLSAEVPAYQHGVLRFLTKHLRFVQEGVRREAVMYEGHWCPLIEHGITIDEFQILRAEQDVQTLNTSVKPEEHFLKQLVGIVDAPADWSEEHDHYLYGSPKRSEVQDG